MAKYTVLVDGKRIRNNETKAYIPIADGNSNYKEYIEWRLEGNEPDVENITEKQRQKLQKELQQLANSRINSVSYIVNQIYDTAYAVYLLNKKLDVGLNSTEQSLLDGLATEFLNVKNIVEKKKTIEQELESAEDPTTVNLEL